MFFVSVFRLYGWLRLPPLYMVSFLFFFRLIPSTINPLSVATISPYPRSNHPSAPTRHLFIGSGGSPPFHHFSFLPSFWNLRFPCDRQRWISLGSPSLCCFLRNWAFHLL
ncbi:hypothetical protein LXL04_020549 [Taraxacum kok-saghyz]